MDSNKKHLFAGMAIGAITMLALNSLMSRWCPGTTKAIEEAIENNDVAEAEIKRILVCGSGMMVPGIVSYLTRNKRNLITIASNIIEDAEAIAKSFPAKAAATLLDVNDHDATVTLIKAHDIVVSYVPPFLHPKIFKACIDARKNLVTASYISAEMLSYHEEAQKHGLLFLNE